MADRELDEEIRKAQAERRAAAGVGLSGVSYDQHLYGSGLSLEPVGGGGGIGGEYVTEVVDEEEGDGGLPAGAGRHRTAGGDGYGEVDLGRGAAHPASRAAHAVIAAVRQDAADGGADAEDPMAAYRSSHGSGLVNTRIADRESSYHAKRRGMALSPTRAADAGAEAYGAMLREQALLRERQDLTRRIAKAAEDAAAALASGGALAPGDGGGGGGGRGGGGGGGGGGEGVGRKRRRWDDAGDGAASDAASVTASTVVDSATRVTGGGGVGTQLTAGGGGAAAAAAAGATAPAAGGGATARRRRGWDVGPEASVAGGDGASLATARWDETPQTMAASGAHDPSATPAHPSMAASGSWDASPPGAPAGGLFGGALPAAKRSRWDETPAGPATRFGAPAGGALEPGVTPMAAGAGDATPVMSFSGATPTPSALLAAGAVTPAFPRGGATPAAALASMTPDQVRGLRLDVEMEARNRPLTDEDLDAMLPSGYRVLDPPAGYVPLRTPSRKLTATPLVAATPGFTMGDTPARDSYGVPLQPSDLAGQRAVSLTGQAGDDMPFIKPEDMQYFGSLLAPADEVDLGDKEAVARRTVMELLLGIKNGTPPQRRQAMRKLVTGARELGPGVLFDQLMPLLMSPSLEDQERHVLVKVIDKVLFRLDELVRPYVHKILMVIVPMLIDEDYHARVEGREIIANLAKAAGLPTMISVMRPDIDHSDEYVRNTTSRAFAVVAAALGIGAMMPFLRAVCGSKKSWTARHTGIKIIQQTALLMGCAVLPHLRELVDTVGPGLEDEQHKVRVQAALAIASLAEAASPYGIECFEGVMRPLWMGVQSGGARTKMQAAFLKAFGFVIPLMEPEHAAQYSQQVMPHVITAFASPDDEMKKVALKVVEQVVGTEGVEAAFVRAAILPEFFRNFWVRRMALDRRNYKALVETTVRVAGKVGAADIVRQLCDDLKDESEPYRRMVLEALERILAAQGATDIDARLEEQLLDGLLYAFQEQSAEENSRAMLQGFGAVVTALGVRCKPYLAQMAAIIKWRLNNKAPTVRQQAADLVAKVAGVMRVCGLDDLLGHLGVVLYECLGEEYPDVLGSILGGLTAVVAVIGMAHMQPPVKDLLPRLTPILRNRNEKVQENCIDLVGRIADRGATAVDAREWMRICFQLMELLKAPKKSIRRACTNTFGYIAKAIGPQDVMHALLNNLKVAERQIRICTTVAIAIVAETCQPFTVLPALMNEYRVPDINVQHGVLKAMSFLFEYIGEQARDYVYAVTPLLADALIDRDILHRQTALFAVKHLTLGVSGLGCEDALDHLMNYVWPNVFETTAHLALAMYEVTEAMRVSLGPAKVLAFILQGLFHPARKVRTVYWRLYNNLYAYAAHALTPAYPRIPADAPATTTAATAGYGYEAAATGGFLALTNGGGGVGVDGGEVAPNAYHRTYLDLFV